MSTIDAYQLAPQLLARFNGGKDLVAGIKKSLGGIDGCRKTLEDLQEGKFSVEEAVAKLISQIEAIHQHTHNHPG